MTEGRIEAPARLAILGGGQLGRFFVRAAQELGYAVWVLDPDPEAPAGRIAERHLCGAYDDEALLADLAAHCAAASTEFENVPAASLAWLAARMPVRPGAAAVAVCQDRIEEKSFLARHGLPHAPFLAVRTEDDLARAPEALFPGILNTARFGYDGKGQAVVADRHEARAAFARFGRDCVLEARLALEAELSVVLARGADGRIAAFEPGLNVHRKGILDTTFAPAPLPAAVLREAGEIAAAVAEALDYVGTLGVEFFYAAGKLYVNEMAPRPHNSGHHTLDAYRVCQFEQQVRALCGLPLAVPEAHSPAVMVNLLGEVWFAGETLREPPWHEILSLPGLRLHLYGKREARRGRKMGHFTVTAATLDEACAVANEARRRLALPPLPPLPQ
ncbi:MAG: 5-(carboxyamino)imidazole ribonucleotide synthase [Rhodocyclales bacterium]|nr:5-(carboxyamino)imidazole ribonucleotide synthase [Rhodocyclales bacterium]